MIPDPGVSSLTGRVALVTGASIGIGAAAAIGLARAGAHVVVTSRDPARLGAVVRRIADEGAQALALPLDVRDTGGIKGVIDATLERFGRLDLAVNNAGVALIGRAADVLPEEWDAVMETNVRGSFFVAQAAAAAMRRTGGGCIVNLSSTFARAVVAERAVYGTSKAALEHLTRLLAKEWASDGIRVNAIAPTTTVTETREHMFPTAESRRRRIAEIPLGRLGEPDDVVAALLFIAGAGSFMTGQTLYVDGGYTLR